MERRRLALSCLMVISVFALGKHWLQSQESQEVSQSYFKRKVKSGKQKVKSGVRYVKDSKAYKKMKEFSVLALKKYSNRNNPYKAIKAQVREHSGPTATEKRFLSERLPHITRAQNTYFAENVTEQDALRIGLAFGGGGYSAMILTTGYMEALSELGLVDSAAYISALSGSSWFLAPWMLKGESVSDYKQSLIKKINDGVFDLKNLADQLVINPEVLVDEVLFPKFVFGQSIGLIDLYGALLSQVFISDLKQDKPKHLSQLWDKVKDGKQPFPIFNAIAKHNNTASYDWYEFNPIEVRDVEHKLAVDTFGFGRTFDKGTSTDYAPEQPLGILMGIFGSRYAVDAKNLLSSVLGRYEAPSMLDELKYSALEAVFGMLEKEGRDPSQNITAKMNNPWMNVPSETGVGVTESLRSDEEIRLMDASIDLKLPLPSLLDRGLDVVIVGDASDAIKSGVQVQDSLSRALSYAKAYKGYEYQKYAEVEEYFNDTLTAYIDYHNLDAPVIIHINYQKDPSMLERVYNPQAAQLIRDYNLNDFDPLECIKKGYCGAFNFNYKPEQLEQFAAMAEFNVFANQDALRKILVMIRKEKQDRMGTLFVPDEDEEA